MNTNKLQKLLVALCIMVGACVFVPANSEVQAASSQSTQVHYEEMDIAPYRSGDVYTAPKPTEEGYEDWIFAGWFKDKSEDNAIASTTKTGTRWAKFVPAEVLSVKCQVADGTTAEQEGNSKMRIISSIDSKRYNKVGFDIVVEGRDKPIHYESTSIAKSIVARNEGVDYNYSPNIFDLKSNYFITVTINNIPSDYFDNGFYIKPYWVTKDNTKVYGIERFARVEDYYLDIVNVPVRLYSDATVTSGTVEVNYGSKLRKLTTDAADVDAFTYLGCDTGSLFSQVTVTDNATDKTVICVLPENAKETKADGMLVNLRFQKNTAENNILPKTNTFGVQANLQDAEGADVAVVTMDSVYQYHNTEYTGAADTAWYMNKVSGQTEFVITTPDELYGLASLVNAGTFGTEKVYLASDITVNASVLDSSGKLIADTSGLKSWTPIGTRGANVFKGQFDGQEHFIRGLYKSASSTRGVALFGGAEDATIKNLKVIDSYFLAQYEGAAICGQAKNCTFENIYTNASVYAQGHEGGIVGLIQGGTIQKCWVDSIIDVGESAYGYVGGIVGVVQNTKLTVKNCLFSGSVKNKRDVGGFIGHITCETNLTDCLNVGSVAGTTTTNIGMGVGTVHTSGVLQVEDVYSLTDETYLPIAAKAATGIIKDKNGSTIDKSEAITTIEDKTAYYGYDAITGLSGLDFNNTWVVRQSDTPVLKAWVESGALYTPSNDVWVSGQGETYTITTPEQLYKLAQDVNSGITYENTTFILGKDITINSGNSANWGTKAPKYNWIPIGNSSNPFKGHFNDTEELRAIKGLYTKQTGTNFVGLFGTVQNGSVKNIKVTNSYFSGAQWVGAISAYSVKSTINTTYSDATVIASNAKVGGIIGNLCGGTVSNSWFAGTVTHSAAKQHAGGIVGQISDVNGSVVDNCLVTGTIQGGMTSGNAYAGGIVGGITGNTNTGKICTATVTNCLSAAKSVTANGATSCVSSVIGGLNLANVTASNNYGLQGSCNDVLVGSGGTNVTITHQPKVVSNIKGGNGSLLPLDFETYWVPIKNEVPALKSFIAENDENIVNLRAWYNGPAENRGNGSEENPYVIQDEYELYALAQIVNTTSEDFEGKYIELQDDLTFNTNTNFEEEGYEPVYTWTPIGTTTNTFKGKFNATSDAEIHTIKGLYANGSDDAKSTWYVSLFGVAADAEIKNLKVIDSYFAGNDYVSAIVSKATNTLIDSVYTNATVSATETAAAGIVGNSDSNSIHNTWFDGQVTGQRYSGGLIGIGISTDIVHCLNTGDVLGRNYSGNAYIGGLVGVARGSFELKDTLSAARKMEQLGTSAKGLVIGASDQAGTQITIEYTYSQDGVELDVVGARSDNKYPCTLSKKLHTVSNIKGGNGSLLSLDFENYWVPIQNEVPALKSFVAENDENSVNLRAWYDGPAENRGDGSQDNPYVIQDEYELYVLAQIVNAEDDFEGKYIELQDDLTFNLDTDFETKGYEPAYQWIPIGTSQKPFKGNFDGGMHSVSGLYATASVDTSYSDRYIGLFGYVSGTAETKASVQNIKVENSCFKGKYHISSVVAYMTNGMVDAAYSNATINASSGHGGGIVGTSAGGTIKNCWFNGSVKGGEYIGGITSFTTSTKVTIQHCLNAGPVEATTQEAGGIIGRVNAETIIEDSLNVGTVKSANTERGSITGYINGGSLTTTLSYGYSESGVENGATGVNGGKKSGITATYATLLTDLQAVYDIEAYERLNMEFWTARVAAVPIPSVFATEGDYGEAAQVGSVYALNTNLKGSGDSEQDPILIETAADLYGYALLSQNQKEKYANKYVKLVDNITVNPAEIDENDKDAVYYDWYPIGSEAQPFKGTFLGNNKTISGLYKSYDKFDHWVGLFDTIATTGTVQDLTVDKTFFVYYGDMNKAPNQDDPTRMGIIAGELQGTVKNVYSKGDITSRGVGIGGIAGVISDAATVTNCWYAGEVTGTKEGSSSYIGGIAGFVDSANTNIIKIEHCLVSGNVLALDKRVGGLIGSVKSGNLTITDCLFSGDIEGGYTTKGDVEYVGMLIGAVEQSASGTSVSVNSSYGVNDYASYDIGASLKFYDIKRPQFDNDNNPLYEEDGVTQKTKALSIGEGSLKASDIITKDYGYPTVNGSAFVSKQYDRLIGYAGKDASLDYETYWTLTENGTPVLKTFADPESVYDGSGIDALLELDYWNSSDVTLSKAENKGQGTYLLMITAKDKPSYDGYLAVLGEGIFEAYGNDQSSEMNGQGVYNAVYTSAKCGDEANDDWVLNVTYVDGTIYISIATGQPVSQHLEADSITPYSAEDGYTTSGLTPTFHMIEQSDTADNNETSASSYVIQLSNGHFIIIDGGHHFEAPYLLEYLENLSEGKKPIIEAWILSHGHFDHVGALMGFVQNADKYAGKVYLEGIYFNEPNDAVTTTYADGHHHYMAYIERISSVFKTTKGEEADIYRMMTGQRYTFDGVTMDILMSQELLEGYSDENESEAFNETSTWTLFTINEKKLLTAGDASDYAARFINEAYSDGFTVDVFTALHHGNNTSRYDSIPTFEKRLTINELVLYPNYQDVLNASGVNYYIQTRNESFVKNTKTQKYYHYGNGTVVLTFNNDAIVTKTLEPNDWENEYTQ